MSDKTTCSSYECQRFEQCDDCFMIDHLKECKQCEEYDHYEAVKPFQQWEIDGARQAAEYATKHKRAALYQSITGDLDTASADAGEPPHGAKW